MPRRCSTPGCTLADFHEGAHSHECCHTRFRKSVWHTPRKAIVKPAPVAKRKKIRGPCAVNDFQLGIETVRRAMDEHKGVRLRLPRTAFSGYWPDAPEECRGVLLGASHEGKFVAEALFEGDRTPTLLTSSSLMLYDTCAWWRNSHLDPARLHVDKCDANVKHTNAFARAVHMYETLLDAGISLEGTIVATLDGMGTNRMAGEKVLRDRGVPVKARPVTWTFERNADVALAQRVGLGFGDAVKFTGGDAHLSGKKSLLLHDGAPTLEHLVLTHNRILSEEDKRKIVCLNLDYCGGPPGDARVMQAVLAHLPSLHMVSVTMAKRNHKNLDVDEHVPPPYGFRLHTTYTSNPRVVCKLYVRVPDVVRHVAIPGYWWKRPDPRWKHATFDGVVVERKGDGSHVVYVPHDDRVYDMSAGAVKEYAA